MGLNKTGIHTKKNTTNVLSMILGATRKFRLNWLDFHSGSESSMISDLGKESEMILRETESKKSQAIAIVHEFQKC